MKRLILVAIALVLPVGAIVSDARAEVAPEEVRRAIERGVKYLKQEQKADGSWPDLVGPPHYHGGVTALCTLALLNSGVEPDDEHMARALRYLRSKRLNGTYAMSLQTMVFCKLGKKSDLPLIQSNVSRLQQMQVVTGPGKGAWSYDSPSGGDPSNAQFAVLALHEAERAGIKVSDQTWRLARAYWQRIRHDNGSWSYVPPPRGGPGTGSMTCAGITSMIITADKILDANAEVSDTNQILCCQSGDDDQDQLEQSLDWLGRNFSVVQNPGHRAYRYYYLYGIERVGRLTARRFLGEHDWYREGVDRLVKDQVRLSGYWPEGGGENNRHVTTSFALLFLSKGRRPTLMAKLSHVPDTDWNSHRSDVDNLTRFVESHWKMDLTWQVVNMHAAGVDDLLQSPVIYLGGSKNPLPIRPALRKQLAGNLRDYLDRGGFIFAESYAGGKEFDQGFRDLMGLVFPEKEYELRLLDPAHPVWNAEIPVPPDQIRPLEGVDFGCRTSVVYARPDPPGRARPSLSCLWELSRPGRERTYDPVVQRQIDAGLAIGVNVLAYATNRELEDKLDKLSLTSGQRVTRTTDRGLLSIAKIRHPGGCNAAPRALINLLESAGHELKMETEAETQLISLTDDALFDHHMVFMHGRNRFRLTDAERSRLRTFVERGGMLFADSICASSPFVESFREEMRRTFSQVSMEPIPAGDPMWTPEYGGYDVTTVTRRDPRRNRGDGPLRPILRKVSPELEGIRIKDRWAVVFSPYDLSCALEKHDSLDCNGYARRDAARIGLNVIMYSLQQ